MALKKGREITLQALFLAWAAALFCYAGLRFWMAARFDMDWLGPGAGLMLLLLGCLGALALDAPLATAPRRLGWSFLGLVLAAWGQALLWLRVDNKEQYLALGLLALLGGSALFLFQARPEEEPQPRFLSLGWELAAFSAILLFAAALRLFRLGDLPANAWFDEINLARSIQDHVLHGGEAPAYVGELVENPGAYLMVGGLVFKLFGVSLTALRALAAFYGWLALFPFYFLARRWFGAPWALAALLIYSSMRWTLIPQRIAFMSGFALFWALCAVYFYWRALSSRGLMDLCLAGISLGATLHAYTPTRSMVLVLLGFSLLHLRLFRGFRASQALAFALPALLVAAPMLAYMGSHWHEYALRSQQVSILNDIHAKGWGELWISFSKHLLMFNFRGDHQARHNLSFWPQLDFLSALAFVPALILAHGRAAKDPRAALLLLWFWAMLAQGVLTMTVEAPQAHRTILAAPCVALMLIWFARQASAGLGRAFAKGWPRPLAVAGLIVLLAVPAFNAFELFGPWAQDAATWRSFSPQASLVARRAAAAGDGTTIYASALEHEYQFNGFERFAFLNFYLGLQGRGFERMAAQGNAVAPCKSLLAIWGASDGDISERFKKEFPKAAIEESRDPFDQQVDYLAAALPYASLPKAAPKQLFFRP